MRGSPTGEVVFKDVKANHRKVLRPLGERKNIIYQELNA